MSACRCVGVNISFLEHNNATFRNILVVHDRLLEQVNVEYCMQE